MNVKKHLALSWGSALRLQTINSIVRAPLCRQKDVQTTPIQRRLPCRLLQARRSQTINPTVRAAIWPTWKAIFPEYPNSRPVVNSVFCMYFTGSHGFRGKIRCCETAGARILRAFRYVWLKMMWFRWGNFCLFALVSCKLVSKNRSVDLAPVVLWNNYSDLTPGWINVQSFRQIAGVDASLAPARYGWYEFGAS